MRNAPQMLDGLIGIDVMTLGGALADARSRRSRVVLRWPEINSAAAANEIQVAAAEAMDDMQIGYTSLRFCDGRGALTGDRLIHGPLLADSLVDDVTPFRLPQGMIGAQYGLLFRMGRSYPRDEEISRRTLMTAVVGCELALVLLGRRLPGSTPLSAENAVADFALHVADVRGPAIVDWPFASRASTIVTLAIDGHVLDRIAFKALFDRAFDGLVGLARSLAARGSQLEADDRAAVGARLPALQVLAGQRVSLAAPELAPLSIALI